MSKISRIRFQVFENKLDGLWEMDVLTITHQQKIQLKLHKNEWFCVDRKFKVVDSFLSPFLLSPALPPSPSPVLSSGNLLLSTYTQLCVAMVITVFTPPLPIII